MAVDFAKLEDNNYLLDLLIQMEDVLDTFDTYVFENWFDAQIVDGPIVRRYWLVMTLKTPFRQMPDPRAAKRLVRQGVMVEYDRISGKDANADKKAKKLAQKNEGDEANADKQDKPDENDKDSEGFWLIKVSIPRRLVQEINSEELEAYDDEIDAEDVQAANDQGIDDESAFAGNGEEEQEEDRQQEQEENSETNLEPDEEEEGDEDENPAPAGKGAAK